MEDVTLLKVGTSPSTLTVISEPFVLLNFRGYVPCVNVRVHKSGLEKTLVISAKSLAEPLELLRKKNGNMFTGLSFSLAKADESKMALYILASI